MIKPNDKTMTRDECIQLRLFGLTICSLAAISLVPASSWAVAVFPSGAEFNLELAADPQTRQQGYMYREQVGSKEGMLFLFDRSARHSFWMKNCKVALDIVWLDRSFRVVDIARDQQPCPADGECPRIPPRVPARYVLEVAGGTTAKQGLSKGDRLVILAEPPLP